MKEINDDDIKWLMDNPNEAKVVLLNDFCLFIRVFHYYMTRSQFEIKPFHKDLADKLVSYMKGTNKKQNLYIGLSPRAGKSQMIIDFCAYSYAANPFSNFIYTSYSGDLCVKHSKKIRDIVESELFQKVFGIYIDSNTSAANLWKIDGGGEFRSVPMGGAITGFGAGTFDDCFGGAILVDDFMKADSYRSDAEKQSCIEIFENTLRSRKNRPAKDPTIIIAQRLAKDDLVDYIKERYPDEWDFYVIPAYNEETGESFWEERYPAKFLEQMKEENPFLFYSQYQQEPIAMGGGVIHTDWFRYYKDIEDTRYRRIFITADTAVKTKEWNDFTAIGVWGVTIGNKLRLLDMVHGKFEIPELQTTMLAVWEKWQKGIGNCRCTEIIIEDRASGMQLIQQLRRIGGLPIRPITPEKDKLSRVYDVIPQIAAGNVELPVDENSVISKKVLSEMASFSADDSHTHDDICFVAGTKIATLFGLKNIEDVKVGELIITPIGVKKCIESRQTGIKETIKKFGLEATPNHKVFYGDKFERLDMLTYAEKCSMFTLKELSKWAYKKQLYSMEQNINSWGREGIISLYQIPMLEERMPKDFMLRCGSFIREKKFRKVGLFIIKTIIALIMILTIWSVFHAGNILKGICKREKKRVSLKQKNGKNILKESEKKRFCGTSRLMELLGIRRMLKKMQKKQRNREKREFVSGVVKNMNVEPIQNKNSVVEDVSVVMPTKCKKAVYNIRVEDAGCYYANRILVSNCDMCVYAIDKAFVKKGYF